MFFCSFFFKYIFQTIALVYKANCCWVFFSTCLPVWNCKGYMMLTFIADLPSKNIYKINWKKGKQFSTQKLTESAFHKKKEKNNKNTDTHNLWSIFFNTFLFFFGSFCSVLTITVMCVCINTAVFMALYQLLAGEVNKFIASGSSKTT